MHDIAVAIFLGIVQGVTEFLPVSSTAHLIIFETYLQRDQLFGLAFDVNVHVATALSVIWFFRRDWLSMDRSLLLAIAVGTIPAVTVGYFFEDFISGKAREIPMVIIGLVLGSVLIIFAEYIHKRLLGESPHKHSAIGARHGFLLGVFQSLALIPGVSRSGATISGGLILGKNRYESTRFSFLLATPIIIGAAIKKYFDYAANPEAFSHTLFLLGFITAFVAGLWALKFITRLMQSKNLIPFVYYRLVLAGLLILITMLQIV